MELKQMQYPTTLHFENDDHVCHDVHSLILAATTGAIHPEDDVCFFPHNLNFILQFSCRYW